MTPRTWRRPHVLAAAIGAFAIAGCSDVLPIVAPSTAAAPALASDAVAPDREFVEGRIIVRFTPGAARSEIAEAHRARKQRDLLLERTELLEVPVGEELAVAAQLSKNPNVEFAEPDYITRIGPCEVASACTLPDGSFSHYKWDLHNTGSINDQVLGWGLVQTGKADADIDWAETYDRLGPSFSGSAVIGILDTGIRPTHTAFAGKILGGRRFLSDTFPVTNYIDDHSHGSHVSGIAAGLGTAAVPGVAYGQNIKLLVGKVCNSAGTCPSSATADGIVWMADNGANVINMSLGSFGGNPDGTGSAAQQAALRYAQSKNVLPVCATGNDDGKANYFGGVGYPARFEECLAVGATNWSDTKANYSNYGPQIDISAPGGAGNPTGSAFSLILAPSHTSNTGYNWKAGTSMATPQVAGLAALLFATGMTDANAVRARIIATADDIEAAGWDPRTGAGRINVYRAITGLDPSAPPVAAPGAGYTGRKGVAVQFDGSASYDPNGKAVTFAWNFGDAASASNTATGAKPTHTYLRAGSYTVTLTVTDAAGQATTSTTQAVIPNVVPNVSFAGSTILQGETYSATGSFSDPDPDQWTASVRYTAAESDAALALAGQSFVLGRRYMAAGAHLVTVTVSDDDGGIGTGSATVTVWTPQQGIQALLLDELAAPGAIAAQTMTQQSNILTNLRAPLLAAQASLDRGDATPAVQQIEAFVHQLQAQVQSGNMAAARGGELTAAAQRVIASIQH